MKTFLLLCLALLSLQVAQATHILGGYIQAKSAAGSPLTYEVTVVLYMNTGNAADQVTSLTVCFGDGTAMGTDTRVSRQLLQDKNVSINTYRLTHSYAGPGTYTLTASFPNRTTAENINQATQEPLALMTTFTANAAGNQTPTLTIPTTGFRIAANQRIVFSLKATDTDGDSLVYSLAKPLTNRTANYCTNQRVALYQFPNDVTRQGTFKLNTHTGDLVWDAPVKPGYYSVAIAVYEYRNGILVSQTTQETPLIVEDLPGTPSTIPPYEIAIEGTVVTALSGYADSDINLTTFPNPVDDRLQVLIQTSNPTIAILQLLDVNGRKLHELEFAKASRQHEQVISIESLAPGIYLLRANVGGRTLLRKIVKK